MSGNRGQKRPKKRPSDPKLHPESVRIKRLRKPGGVEPVTLKDERLSVKEEKIDFDTGAIEKVFLIDFMCHEKFVWELGPRINVITGRNGAGKSSIIHAIVLGLGGNAKTTGRGYTSIGNFVKSGQGKAVVCIHLCNRGERSYKPETYGDKIIFKRIIYSNGTSEKIIMDQNEEPINTGKSATRERDKILEEMGIQLDNPAVILCQERAKTLFGSNWDPYAIYTMFSQSTLIQTTKNTYKKFEGKIDSLDKTISVLLADSKKIKDDYKKKKVEHGENEREKQELDDVLKHVFKRRQQLDILDKTKKLVTKKEDIKRANEVIEIEQNNLAQIKFEIGKATTKQNAFNLEKVDAEQKVKSTKDERLSTLRDELELEKDLAKREMAHNKAKGRVLEKLAKVNIAKDQFNQSKTKLRQKEEEEKTKTLNLLKEQLKKSEEKRKDSQKKKDEADQILKGKKNDLNQIDNEINSINSESKRLSSDRKEYEGARSNQSFDFGEDHARLAKEIEKAQWKIEPVGPIAKYVKVVGSTRDPDTATKVLEIFIGRALLSSYVVFDTEDRQTLKSIVSRDRMVRKPGIFKMRHNARTHDVENYRVRKSKDFECLLDMLSFEDDRVRNLLIDAVSIETCIYLDQHLAKKLFSDPSKVPPKATVGLTPDCYKFVPKTDRQSYASYFIGNAGNQTRMLRCGSGRDVIEKSITEIDSRMAILRSDKKDLENAKKKLLDEIEHCKTNVRICQSSYSSCQESHNKIEIKIDDLTKSIKQHGGLQKAFRDAVSEHQEAKKTAKSALTEKEIAEEKLKAKKREVQCLVRKEQDLKEKIPKMPEKLDKLLTELNKKKREKDIMISKLDFKLKKMVEGRNNVLSKLEETKSNMDQELEIDPKYATLNLAQVTSILKEISKAPNDSRSSKIQEDVFELKSRMDQGLFELKKLEEQKRELRSSLQERRSIFNGVFDNTCRAVRNSYNIEMSKLGLDITTLVFDENFKLEINGKSPEALSGGEKSKAMVCFILALWCVQHSPFMCLDEWDVALDDDARQTIEKSLLNFARKSLCQHIFISPIKDATGAGFLHDENLRKYVKSYEIKKR